MYKVLEAGMLGIRAPLTELAPLAVKYGFEGLGVPREILSDVAKAGEAASVMRDHGLQWSLLPTTADMFSPDLDGQAFEDALVLQEEWAATGERIGVRYSYNHIWPSSATREFDENLEWHIRRLERIQAIFQRHGIHYGLEFLGPYELRTAHPYPFVHSVAGVLTIADAAGGSTGFLFDTYHWYTGSRRLDDLYFAAQHCDRMINMHLNDGVAGKGPDEQLDLTREMPMTTGVIDSARVYRVFHEHGYAGPVMCEPMRPTTTRLAALPLEAAVAEAAAAFRRVEGN